MLKDTVYGPYTLQVMQLLELLPDMPVRLSSWPDDKWVNASELPELKDYCISEYKWNIEYKDDEVLSQEVEEVRKKIHFERGRRALSIVGFLRRPSPLEKERKKLLAELRLKTTADERKMLLVVTDKGDIWNHDNPFLEKYKDQVLVVCLGLGREKVTLNGESVSNLFYPAKEELCNKFKSYTDVVFFIDSEANSLYPYHIARENLISSKSSDYSIHLVCAIDSENNHHNMLSDLSYVNSVAYYETNKVFRNFYDKDDIFRYSYPKDEYIRDNLGEMMPYFLNFPHDKSGRYYFDFTSMSYKSIDEGVGIVEMQLPRIDGKEVCNMLRRQRMELAAANNIPFESEECPSTGACAGTCPKCDEEAEYLRKCLEKIPEEKRVYPQFDPKKEV